MGSGCSKAPQAAPKFAQPMPRRTSVTYVVTSEPDAIEAFPAASRFLRHTSSLSLDDGRLKSIQHSRMSGRQPERDVVAWVPSCGTAGRRSSVMTEVLDDSMELQPSQPMEPPMAAPAAAPMEESVYTPTVDPTPPTVEPSNTVGSVPPAPTSTSIADEQPSDAPGRLSASGRKVGEVHDVKLSKRLTKLLRHSALHAGLSVDRESWALLKDALALINASEGEGGGCWVEADVVEMVRLNDKRRFELCEGPDGLMIRATEGAMSFHPNLSASMTLAKEMGHEETDDTMALTPSMVRLINCTLRSGDTPAPPSCPP